MRKILGVVVLVALAWSGYWLWSAQARQAAISNWLAERQAEGWQAEAADVAVRGFPLRLDLSITDLALADPAAGLAWQAPGLEIRQTAWDPTALEVIWPNMHLLGTPEGVIAVENDALTADLVTARSPALPLERAALQASTVTLTAENGDTTSLAGLSAEILRMEETTYRAQVLAEGVALSAPVLDRVRADLPRSLEKAELDLTARFDRRWDLRAIDTARPQPTALDLRLLEANWGPMALKMSADLEIGPEGVPTGSVSVQARNWRDMLAVAEQSGALPEAVVDMVADGLALLAGLSGNSASLDLDLRLANGQVYLGFLPIGPAPRLVLR